MKGKDKGVKRGRPHSEMAGEAVLGSGGRATLFRALLELTCSRCGGVIREGDLFTREIGPASELPLLRLCRGCVPFKMEDGLLDSLLLPEDGGELLPRSLDGGREGEGDVASGAGAGREQETA